MHLIIPLELIGIAADELSSPRALEVRDRLAGAVMIVRSGRSELLSLLGEIRTGAIVETQRKLLALSPDSEEFRMAIWSS
jgi:hypothetical protein